MMKKIFKWDFIYYFNQLKWYVVTSVLLAILTYLFDLGQQSFIILSHLYQPAYIGTIVSVFGLLIYSYILTIQKFYRSMFKDEAFLTHTLPIKKGPLVLAKMLASVATITIVVITAMFGLWVIRLINFEAIMHFAQQDSQMFQMLLLSVITTFIFMICSYFILYAALSYGFSFNKKEWLYFAVGLVIYYVIQQILGIVNLGIHLLIFPSILNEPETMIDAFLSITIGSIVINIAMAIVGFYVTKHYLEKKLNIKNG